MVSSDGGSEVASQQWHGQVASGIKVGGIAAGAAIGQMHAAASLLTYSVADSVAAGLTKPPNSQED
jgi:hypothetical protein